MAFVGKAFRTPACGIFGAQASGTVDDEISIVPRRLAISDVAYAELALALMSGFWTS